MNKNYDIVFLNGKNKNKNKSFFKEIKSVKIILKYLRWLHSENLKNFIKSKNYLMFCGIKIP